MGNRYTGSRFRRCVLMGLGLLSFALVVSGFTGCQDSFPVSSPPGYDLGAPKKFIMSEALQEISGITFLKGNSDSLYAIEDETGKIFFFHPGDGKYSYQKFGDRGDYEDVTILNNKEFVVLRNDGSLFVFPVSLLKDGKIDQVRAYDQILPPGEYEGLFGDDNGKLIALCKNCPDVDQGGEVTGYLLAKNKQDQLVVTGNFKIDASMLKKSGGKKKVKFHPSAIARHPLTREWYILSSVNKVLLVLDDGWNVRASYPLNPSLFKQPEGLAFDEKGNLYISNEGQEGNANVLLFAYHQPK
ncbi:SdiA-regulated domain-containing protein [Flavitalea flava]